MRAERSGPRARTVTTVSAVPSASAGTAAAKVPSAPTASAALPAPGILVRLGFGFTSVVENTKFQVYEFFLIFYYAQVLGLPGGLAGLAIASAAISDAVFDPLIGSFSDTVRSRFGRRHLLMYLAVLPTGLCLYLLFVPPAGLGRAGLFAWLLLLSIATRTAGSFYSVPAAALAAELTERATVRAELGIWRQAVASASQLALTWLVFHFAFTPTRAFPRGQENPANYPAFALIVAAIVVVGALVGAVATQARMRAFERERRPPRVRVFSVTGSLVATWQALAELVNFRAIFLGLMFAGLMGSYFRALNLSLGSFFWELSTRQTGAWLMSLQFATFAAAVACRAVVGRIEPRTLYLSGVVLMLAAYVLPPLARLLGFLPANGSPLLVDILYAANMAVGVGTGLIMTCSLVLFAESADEYAFVKRESRTGMLLAFLPLGNKTASSLGKLLAGLVVQWTALPVSARAPGVTAGASAAAAVASASSLHLLGIAAVAVTLVAGLLALFFFLQYHLTRQRYAEIVRGLESMRAAEEEP